MNLIVIDTETGGFDANKNALLSVGLARLNDDFDVVDTLDVFIHPERGLTVETQAAAVNGYTPDLWKERGEITIYEAMKKIATWISTTHGANSIPIAIAHNAPFDKRIMDAAQARSHVRLGIDVRWRDTQQGFMFVCDALKLNPINHKLETLAKTCGHWKPDNQRGAHTAHDDVLACAAGYKWIMAKIREGQLQTNEF